MAETAEAVGGESKITITARLQREGRWPEASAYKDSQIAECRGEGMTRAQANTEGWRRMREKYPPLPPPEELHTDNDEASAEDVADAFPLFDGKSADLKTDVLWCYSNFANRTVRPADAPSAGAWAMLEWARSSRNKFFEIVVKILQLPSQDDEDRAAITHDRKNVEQIRRVLAGFVDKPSSLDDAASQFATDWARKHKVRMNDAARASLAASISTLVARFRREGDQRGAGTAASRLAAFKPADDLTPHAESASSPD